MSPTFKHCVLRQIIRENKILTAAWSADTCSLAIATAAGGVKIYDILPNPLPGSPRRSTSEGGTNQDILGGAGKESPVQPMISVAMPPPPRPVRVVLRHEILVKTLSPTPGGGRKAVNRPVSSLATSLDGESWQDRGSGGNAAAGAAAGAAVAGAGILVGVTEGKHLCVWNLATGSTLLTALSVAPVGCTVEKVLWYGPTALVALLYHDGVGIKRVDVHQVDIAREATKPVREQILSWCIGSLVEKSGCGVPDAEKDHSLTIPLNGICCTLRKMINTPHPYPPLSLTCAVAIPLPDGCCSCSPTLPTSYLLEPTFLRVRLTGR